MGVRDLFFAIKARDETGAAFDRVKANLRGVDGMAASTSERLQRMGRGLLGFGAAATAATAPIMLAFRDSLSLYDTQQRAEAKVAQAVRSTGQAAGFAADELFRQASALQDVTRFGDEAILDGVTAQLLTFTNIAGDEFTRAQEAALDLSTVLNQDLKSSSIMLGKALNDPVKGLSAMSRAGITFSEDQAQVIKALAETGDIAAAQGMILDELAKQYGGQARAAAEAGLGMLDQLSNAWGDLKEDVGGIIAEIMPPVVGFFKGLVDGFTALPEPIKRGTVAFVGLTAALGAMAVAGGIAMIALAPISLPILLISAAIAGAIALTVAFWPEIENLGRVAKATFLEIGADVIDSMQSSLESVIGFGNAAVNTFEGAFGSIKAIWGALPAVIGDLVYSAANSLIGGVEAMLNAVAARINGFIQGINGALALLPEWATGEGGLQIGLVPDVSLGRIENQFQGAATQAAADAQAAFNQAFESNPLEVPDLGLTSLAESARATAGALREVPEATAETVDATELLNSVIPDTTDLLGVPGTSGSGGSGLAGAATGAGAAMRGLGEDVEETKGIFDGFGKETSDMLKSMFADGKLSMQDFGDFALSWGEKLLDRLLTSVFDPLGDAIQGLFDNMLSGGFGGGGGGGGIFGGLVSGIGNFFGGLLGFDTGGEMEVTGRSGIDRNVAAFRVSADENIKVVKRGNPDGGRPVNVYIQTPDPAAFKASKGRIAADIARAVGHGSRFT